MGNFFVRATNNRGNISFTIMEKSPKEDIMEFFYRHIDCRIVESISIDETGDLRLIVDEEGLLKQKESAYWQLFDTTYKVEIDIVGTFILCGSKYTEDSAAFDGFNTIKKAKDSFSKYVKIQKTGVLIPS